MDNKVTKKRIAQHLAYDWYKYVLLILVAVFLWYFVFMQINITRKFERLDVFFSCYGNNSSGMSGEFLDYVRSGDDPDTLTREALVNFQSPAGEYYQQLFTTAGFSSDVLVLPRSLMLAYADWFLPWDDYVMQNVFEPDNATASDLAGLAEVKETLEFYVYRAEERREEDENLVINERSEGKIFGVRIDNLRKTDEDTVKSPPFVFDPRTTVPDMPDEEYETYDNEFYLVIDPNSLKIGEKCQKEKYRDLKLSYRFVSFFLLSYGL